MAPHPALACTRDVPKVCVLAEDRLLLPETAARARPVLERLRRIPGAPTRAMPMLDTPDPTALGVDPGQTTPWGKVSHKFGGDVTLQAYALFTPDSYCPTGRYDQAPRPVRRAFRGVAELLAAWVDPGAEGNFSLQGLAEGGDSARVREMQARFIASDEQQRTDFAARELTAARACDPAAARSAVQALAPAP